MLPYDIVDVFTDRPFAGNQLAVVREAADLSTAQCLAIAQEFNFSETTFPSSTPVGAVDYTTRIFTPGGEIPFAGHPTLGTAWVLRSHGLLRPDAEVVTQVCGAGRIGVRFLEDMVELSATPRDLFGPLDDALVAPMLEDVGLSTPDLAGPAWVAGCGLTFVHIPVAAGAVERAVASSRPMREYSERLAVFGTAKDPVEGLNLFRVTGSSPALRVHARVFVPGLSVAEDPATGSAAVGLGMALVASGELPAGGIYDITQGVEMGRPSSLSGSVETVVLSASGAPGDTDLVGSPVASVCRVGGKVQHVGRGEIEVPPAR
ncbi:MAG: PhzF family phenazine biosynthesis protein [Actinomycetota bacterium]|nr:PhzF family phenazine biosynthesis protein [Actinomycetota bacterium]